MGRSGYTDDGPDGPEEQWAYIRQRGATKAAIRGKNGQEFLKELLAALDEMPEKRLAANLFREGGQVCTLECLARKRGTTLADIEVDEYEMDNWEVGEEVASVLHIPESLAREILWNNDELFSGVSPEQRWQGMRDWVASQIKN